MTTTPAAVSNAFTIAAPCRGVSAGVHGATAVTFEVSASTIADSASVATTGGIDEGCSSACSARPNSISAGR